MFNKKPKMPMVQPPPQKSSFNKPKKEKSEDCEIEIKNTSQGKRIRFRGKCSKDEISIFKQENGVE